jgi:kynurenine formamidase/Pyruvate/2-oxoacid:ferredoxin oxidoreductase gamma subunit
MSTETKPTNTPPAIPSIVNDFSITVGTVNGSGSQTANQALLYTFFKMGIPVAGKNIFPSNIQGLPTWYTIRVSKDGYLARSATTEIVIAMNPVSFEKDLNTLAPGGVFLYADDINQTITRDDVVIYPMPVQKLVRASDTPPSLRDYIANMVYVGVLAQLLGIDKEKLRQSLERHFKGKQKPVEMNCNVISSAMEWTAENIIKRDPYRVEPMDATAGYIMTNGNTAGALGRRGAASIEIPQDLQAVRDIDTHVTVDIQKGHVGRVAARPVSAWKGHFDIHEKVKKDPGYHATIEDIKAWEAKYGKIPEGAVVAIRSDWYKKWNETKRFANAPFPGTKLDALKLLHLERKILFHGHEPLDTDTTPNLEGETWLLKNNFCQAEGMKNLDKVPQAGALILIGFAKPEGGTGGYARYIAVCPPGWKYGKSISELPGAPLPKQPYPNKRDKNGVLRPTPPAK